MHFDDPGFFQTLQRSKAAAINAPLSDETCAALKGLVEWSILKDALDGPEENALDRSGMAARVGNVSGRILKDAFVLPLSTAIAHINETLQSLEKLRTGLVDDIRSPEGRSYFFDLLPDSRKEMVQPLQSALQSARSGLMAVMQFRDKEPAKSAARG